MRDRVYVVASVLGSHVALQKRKTRPLAWAGSFINGQKRLALVAGFLAAGHFAAGGIGARLLVFFLRSGFAGVFRRGVLIGHDGLPSQILSETFRMQQM